MSNKSKTEAAQPKVIEKIVGAELTKWETAALFIGSLVMVLGICAAIVTALFSLERIGEGGWRYYGDWKATGVRLDALDHETFQMDEHYEQAELNSIVWNWDRQRQTTEASNALQAQIDELRALLGKPMPQFQWQAVLTSNYYVMATNTLFIEGSNVCNFQ